MVRIMDLALSTLTFTSPFRVKLASLTCLDPRWRGPPMLNGERYCINNNADLAMSVNVNASIWNEFGVTGLFAYWTAQSMVVDQRYIYISCNNQNLNMAKSTRTISLPLSSKLALLSCLGTGRHGL